MHVNHVDSGEQNQIILFSHDEETGRPQFLSILLSFLSFHLKLSRLLFMDLILLYLHPGLFHAFTGHNFDSFQIFSELYGVTTTDIIISQSKLITQMD